MPPTARTRSTRAGRCRGRRSKWTSFKHWPNRSRETRRRSSARRSSIGRGSRSSSTSSRTRKQASEVARREGPSIGRNRSRHAGSRAGGASAGARRAAHSRRNEMKQRMTVVVGPAPERDPRPTLFDNLKAEEREVERDPHALDDRLDRVGRAFLKFHAEHPEVYAELRRHALRYQQIGVRRGVKYFYEVMRHEFIMAGGDPQGFKLCNSYTSRYARLLERENPELRGFFHKRRLTARGGG